MKNAFTKITVAAAAISMPFIVLAQDEPKDGEERQRPPRGERQRMEPEAMAKKMITDFDKDDNMMLDEAELTAYFKERVERFRGFRRGGQRGPGAQGADRPRRPRGGGDGGDGA